MNPTILKVTYIVVGAILAVLGATVFKDSGSVAIEMLAQTLLMAGGVGMGAGLVRRPGDLSLSKDKDTGTKVLLAIPFALFIPFMPHCATLKDVVWPKVAECSGDVITDAVGAVGRILIGDGSENNTSISDRGVEQLQGLASEHGASTIACIIDRLISDWLAPNAAINMNRMAAAARGKDFLNRVGTSVP